MDSELELLSEQAKKTSDLVKMKKNFEEYKKLGYDPVSFEGLNYNLIQIENLMDRPNLYNELPNFGTAIIETENSIIRINSLYAQDRIFSDFAKYDVILEENIIVGLDEYGRLFATQFENSNEIVKGMLRLKNSGYTLGVPRGRVNQECFYMVKSKDIGSDNKAYGKSF